ncbi:DUF3079 domain-containing protein [uncultured Aquabacterium sp.]|uniref:DUF3079 domain-containing protein n=1 Tax=uncultured Aquabacterium sp. TaxID=158753 RepID=UPI00262FDE70|nr:DUF3079 domain-containing protein [uncultured Aquabacterium sp.]
MRKRFPINPPHPERMCWGCDKYCPAGSMACGNGSDRTPHPAELFGPDWDTWTPPQEGEARTPQAAQSAP